MIPKVSLFLFVSMAVAAPVPRPHVDRETPLRPQAVDARTGLSSEEMGCLSTQLLATSLELTQHFRAKPASLHRLFPDGKKLAHFVDVGSGHLEIHDLERGTTLDIEIPEQDHVPDELIVSPDGKRVYLQYHQKIVQVDLTTKRTQTLTTKRKGEPQDALTTDLQLSPDGRQMLTTDRSHPGFALHLWDLDGGKPRVLPLPAGSQSVPEAAKFSADGKSIFALSNRAFVRWDAPFTKPPTRLSLAPLGAFQFALSADGKKIVWHEKDAIVVARLPEGNVQRRMAIPPNASVGRMILSTDGTRLAAGISGFRLFLFNLASGELLKDFSGPSCRNFDMSSDGNRISVQSWNFIEVLSNPSPLPWLRQALSAHVTPTRRHAMEMMRTCVKNPTRWIEAELRATPPVQFPAKTRVPMQTAWDTGDAATIARLVNGAANDERKDITRAFAKRFVDGLNDDVFSRREEVTKLLRDTRDALGEMSPHWDELRHQLFLAAETEGELEATLRLTDPQYKLDLVAPSATVEGGPSLFRHSLLQIANRATRDAGIRVLQRRLKAELYGE